MSAILVSVMSGMVSPWFRWANAIAWLARSMMYLAVISVRVSATAGFVPWKPAARSIWSTAGFRSAWRSCFSDMFAGQVNSGGCPYVVGWCCKVVRT